MEEQRNLFEEAIIKRFEKTLESEGFVNPIVEVFYGTATDRLRPYTYVGCRFVFNHEFTYEKCIGDDYHCSTIESLLFDSYQALERRFAEEAKKALKNYLFVKAIREQREQEQN